MKGKIMNRLTWGGLIRVLCQDRRGTNFSHEHVKLILSDGKKVYLNIKYDMFGYPYFVVVNDKRRHQ